MSHPGRSSGSPAAEPLGGRGSVLARSDVVSDRICRHPGVGHLSRDDVTERYRSSPAGAPVLHHRDDIARYVVVCHPALCGRGGQVIVSCIAVRRIATAGARAMGIRESLGVRSGTPSAPTLADFTVLDLETTGLYPTQDRVVEIGLVRMQPDGREIDAWTTVIDPCRDVGPTSIHGLTARQVFGAPRFVEVADELLWRLGDTILVAHNASFDLRFLDAEFGRAGYGHPLTTAVCTMAGPNALGMVSGRSLADCCAELGLARGPAHCALDDARAASHILVAMFTRTAPAEFVVPGAVLAHRERPPTCSVRLRTEPRPPRSETSLASLASRVRVSGDGATSPEALVRYLAVLDRVIEDRTVTEDELALLAETAESCGLGPDQLASIHHRYVHALWRLAKADACITDAERREIEEVSELLGAPPDDDEDAAEAAVPVVRSDLAGMTVCFTGDSSCSVAGRHLDRDIAEVLATTHGLTVKTAVSGKLDILVLADVDSQSGKARKARELGVRLMDERAFWRALGVAVD